MSEQDKQIVRSMHIELDEIVRRAKRASRRIDSKPSGGTQMYSRFNELMLMVDGVKYRIKQFETNCATQTAGAS